MYYSFYYEYIHWHNFRFTFTPVYKNFPFISLFPLFLLISLPSQLRQHLSPFRYFPFNVSFFVFPLLFLVYRHFFPLDVDVVRSDATFTTGFFPLSPWKLSFLIFLPLFLFFVTNTWLSNFHPLQHLRISIQVLLPSTW